ncbi:hypothetical protein VTK73DRAFT_449 [Phialemonium thermophilum]|uniref:Uncharacterized protein n=1 Tax=Phialemonium thermophilum TaxID=223376 RepID=A0ABR3XEM1_9PEZI
MAEIVRQCDPLDGLRDGIISDPEGCDFNSILFCAGLGLQTTRAVYGVDPNYQLTSASSLGSDLYRYWVVNGSTGDYIMQFDFSTFQLAEQINSGRA